jgi:hypothetical protein
VFSAKVSLKEKYLQNWLISTGEEKNRQNIHNLVKNFDVNID